MTPADVADLTDDQIDRLYRRPAIERAKRMEAEMKGETTGAPIRSLDEVRPDRETFVSTMLSQFGHDRAKWDADYDRLEAAWKK